MLWLSFIYKCDRSELFRRDNRDGILLSFGSRGRFRSKMSKGLEPIDNLLDWRTVSTKNIWSFLAYPSILIGTGDHWGLRISTRSSELFLVQGEASITRVVRKKCLTVQTFLNIFRCIVLVSYLSHWLPALVNSYQFAVTNYTFPFSIPLLRFMLRWARSRTEGTSAIRTLAPRHPKYIPKSPTPLPS